MPSSIRPIQRIAYTLTAAFLLSSPVWANSNADVELEIMSDLKSAYQDGNLNEFTALSQKINRNGLFAPYVEAWLFRLVQDPTGLSDEQETTVWRSKEIEPLLQRHDNTWAAESLRRDWLEQLARTKQWDTFKAQRPLLRYRPDQGVQCADMLYSAHSGQYVRSKVVSLLSEPRRLPRTCRVLIRTLYDKKVVSADDLNLRIYNLVANKHLTNAQKFVDEFNDTDWGKSVPQSILKTASFNPERYLRSVRKGRLISNISIASALTRVAVNDVDDAIKGFNRYYKKHLTPHAQKWLWGHFGYRASLRWNPKAESYFNRSDLRLLGPEYLEWNVRAALLNEHWPKAGVLIDQLPPDLKKEPVWQYWRARAWAANGQLVKANQTWVAISDPYHFYGKLALEELGSTLSSPAKPKPATAEELRAAKNNPGLQRALRFYDAGMRYEGFREFNLQSEQMTDRELLAAATWAQNNQLFDRTIAAADRTKAEHDPQLRYITPFQADLEQQAKRTGVEQAWVYGIIRQESRFVTIARSHVGANGLMQVMPGTARYVARKIGLKNFKLSQVNQIETNLTLGTNYLRIVSEGLDNSPVLASAGYNAGPSRARTWRKRLGEGRQIEGALFAELIPFDETRHYVQNVLSNTMLYSLILEGQTIPLKQRLGIIQGTD